MEKIYFPTIGLEIHAELNTRTKMFCACRNNPKTEIPNSNVCPVCMAHPGALPVINKEAVYKVLCVGAALGASCADETIFDRKNYFYPDIPKGYQISQYKYPLISGGALAGVAVTRVHLEEDTARSSHGEKNSEVDFNRAGVPLMELVTEPVIHSAELAGTFARELQLLLRYLGASQANMEEGQMRVEANISISDIEEKLGTKVEVKNLNSFRSVERAIAYEISRQRDLLEQGETVSQETRGWDENQQRTFSQRKKESSHDYRYFPEPDLPQLRLSEIPEFSIESIKLGLPELPWQVRKRMKSSYLGIADESVETFVQVLPWSKFYDRVISCLPPGIEGNELRKIALSYIGNDLIGLAKKESSDWENEILVLSQKKLTPEAFAHLVQMIGRGELSSRGGKNVLTEMFMHGGEPDSIANKRGLTQQSDENTLRGVVEKIAAAYPTVVEEYRAGKISALQFLIGQGMKESKGSANPTTLKTVFEEFLK